MIGFSAKRFDDSGLSENDWALLTQHLPLYDGIARGLRAPTTAAEMAFFAALQSSDLASDPTSDEDIIPHVVAYRRYRALTAPTAKSTTGSTSVAKRLRTLLLHRLAHWRGGMAPKVPLEPRPLEPSSTPAQSTDSQPPSSNTPPSPDRAEIATALTTLAPECSAPLDTAFTRSFREDLSVVAAEGVARRRIDAVFDAIERAISSNRNDPLAEVFATWQLVHRDTLGPTEPLPDLPRMIAHYSEILIAAGLSSQWSLNAMHIPVEDTMSASIRGFAQSLGWDAQTAVSFFTIARGLERTTAATANPVGLLLSLAVAAHRVRGIGTEADSLFHAPAPLAPLQGSAPSALEPALWCGVLAGVHSVMMARHAGAEVSIEGVAEWITRRVACSAPQEGTDSVPSLPSSTAC